MSDYTVLNDHYFRSGAIGKLDVTVAGSVKVFWYLKQPDKRLIYSNTFNNGVNRILT